MRREPALLSIAITQASFWESSAINFWWRCFWNTQGNWEPKGEGRRRNGVMNPGLGWGEARQTQRHSTNWNRLGLLGKERRGQSHVTTTDVAPLHPSLLLHWMQGQPSSGKKKRLYSLALNTKTLNHRCLIRLSGTRLGRGPFCGATQHWRPISTGGRYWSYSCLPGSWVLGSAMGVDSPYLALLVSFPGAFGWPLLKRECCTGWIQVRSSIGASYESNRLNKLRFLLWSHCLGISQSGVCSYPAPCTPPHLNIHRTITTISSLGLTGPDLKIWMVLFPILLSFLRE